MNAMVRLASKRGAREISAEDRPDAARRERAAHPELPPARFVAPRRNGGKPAGNRGRYHSAAFRDIARDELGLVVTGSGAGLGWYQSSLPSQTPPARSAGPATSHDRTG